MTSFLKLWNLRKKLIGRSRIKIYAGEYSKVLKQMSIIFFFYYLHERKRWSKTEKYMHISYNYHTCNFRLLFFLEF